MLNILQGKLTNFDRGNDPEGKSYVPYQVLLTYDDYCTYIFDVIFYVYQVSVYGCFFYTTFENMISMFIHCFMETLSPLSTNVEIKNIYCSFVGHWMLALYS